MNNQVAVEAKHIGIVAGTAEGAALCYRVICREAEPLMGRRTHPEITMHTFPVHAYMDLIDQEDWEGIAALLSRSATTLARAGAEVLICPNNTLHQAYDQIAAPIPWLHIANVVASEAARGGFHRIGVLGTRRVMEGPLYTSRLNALGIDHLIPNEDDRTRIQRIIQTELIPGQHRRNSRIFLQQVIDRFHAEGCDAVILGCTELPLVIRPEDSALPLLDSTRLLAQAAIRSAIS
jgi:aspartate racemase